MLVPAFAHILHVHAISVAFTLLAQHACHVHLHACAYAYTYTRLHATPWGYYASIHHSPTPNPRGDEAMLCALKRTMPHNPGRSVCSDIITWYSFACSASGGSFMFITAHLSTGPVWDFFVFARNTACLYCLYACQTWGCHIMLLCGRYVQQRYCIHPQAALMPSIYPRQCTQAILHAHICQCCIPRGMTCYQAAPRAILGAPSSHGPSAAELQVFFCSRRFC